MAIHFNTGVTLLKAILEDLMLAEDLRLASKKEITAMKLDVVQRTGRKKDF
ncbi:hypothetical protein [Flavobacterium granuli]|uniref:Uncharacterized protein n=1 Tax=Flavobacterium granuli TaxID=280093 RepID=A0ABU1S3P2_9FLAO|nr:hypothetical protein [Flavobacterium granuli]MDR6845636.1 hypothetical protein [Flavobacterium granuli]